MTDSKIYYISNWGVNQNKKASSKNELALVGVAGFEPATSASQTRRDNRATLHPEWLS